MPDIQFFKTVDEYNKALGVETLHPLVSVIDFSKSKFIKSLPAVQSFGFYTVLLKDVKCGDLKYGRNYYDYQEGTLVFLAPNQVLEIQNKLPHQPKGWALIFHPDLLRGTTLGRTIRDYTFFSYNVCEALHLSEQERCIIMECLHNIMNELDHSIDNHSQRLIVSNIELFLNYCTRFYERQFITRKNVNSDILSRFETIVNDYLRSDKPKTKGFPTVKYCALELNLSPNYLGDLLKKETGKSAQEHIQLQMVEAAKELLLDTNKSVSEISYDIGYEYPQYFSRMFKRIVKMTPTEYRQGK